MNMPHPYQSFVAQFAELQKQGKSLPLGGFAPAARPEIPADASQVLIFSPHPDDECIIGGLPLRLLRESRWRVINVAVTQGSRKDRQAERYQELQQACGFMGYSLIQIPPAGLEKVSRKTRESDPKAWSASVRVIAEILASQRPKAIFFPHEQDWNSTHIGTHLLVTDALKGLANFECFVVETEFWGQMASPNLMVESSENDVADMVAGTSFHVGEVRRNPFHLFLPAWMQDNVRRGSELVGGQGEAAPDFTFATLYRLRKWKQGKLENVFEGGRQVSCTENPASLFA
jgi:LmbE family N-acetylglucosaminyl deacetylase